MGAEDGGLNQLLGVGVGSGLGPQRRARVSVRKQQRDRMCQQCKWVINIIRWIWNIIKSIIGRGTRGLLGGLGSLLGGLGARTPGSPPALRQGNAVQGGGWEPGHPSCSRCLSFPAPGDTQG